MDYVVNMLGQKIDLKNRVPFRAGESVPIPPEAFDKREDTVLYWLGGGGFLLNSRGTVLMLDPVIETAPGEALVCETGQKMLMPFPLSAAGVRRCDAVLYTHADLDHVGPLTSQHLAARAVRRIAPGPVAVLLLEWGVRREEIDLCRPGCRYELGEVCVEVIPSDHPWQLIDPAKYGPPFRGDDTCGFVVRTPDGSFLFPGDTRLLESHLGIPDLDVILVDTCDCAFHLSRAGATVLCNAYPDAHLVPYHYGVFDEPTIPAQEQGDPELVFCGVDGADRRARILAPGEPLRLRARDVV